MNWRAVRAVVRRDLLLAARSRAVAIPAIVVPLVLLVLLPALGALAPSVVDQATAGDLDAILELLPASTVAGLPSDPGLQAAVLLVTHMLAPMVLLVPVLFTTVIATDAIAGERERGTLEGLLLTPMTDRELVAAKLLGALVPAVAIGVTGGVVYAVVANLAVGTQVEALVLPTTSYLVMVLWVGPTMAAAALAAVTLVSARASTTQEAFQLGGLVVLPVVAMLISQAVGAVLLSTWVLAGVGLVALVVAVAMAGATTSALSRERLATAVPE